MGRATHNRQTAPHPVPGRARLVQLVAQLGSPAVQRPGGDFAARVGRLFDLSDTIVLDDTLRRTTDPATGAQPVVAPRGPHLASDLAATRDTLAQTIVDAFELTSINDPLPAPQAARKPGIPPSFDPWRRFYEARQRQLATGVQRLRARARQTVAEQNPALAQLAALDALFDNTLARYSHQCFARLSTVLEHRFRSLWRQHHKTLAADASDRPESWTQAGAWLDRFQQEMRLLLLAELEARLEPVQGLLEALQNKERQRQ